MVFKAIPLGCGEEYSVGVKEFKRCGNSMIHWIDFCISMNFCDGFKILKVEKEEDECSGQNGNASEEETSDEER